MTDRVNFIVRMPRHIHRQVKAEAKRRNRSINEQVIQSCRLALPATKQSVIPMQCEDCEEILRTMESMSLTGARWDRYRKDGHGKMQPTLALEVTHAAHVEYGRDRILDVVTFMHDRWKNKPEMHEYYKPSSVLGRKTKLRERVEEIEARYKRRRS